MTWLKITLYLNGTMRLGFNKKCLMKMWGQYVDLTIMETCTFKFINLVADITGKYYVFTSYNYN